MSASVTHLVPVIGLHTPPSQIIPVSWLTCTRLLQVSCEPCATHALVPDPLQGVPQVEVEAAVIRPRLA